MLDYSIMHPEGILVLRPRAQLSEGDSDALSATVDAYLSKHARLQGVLIHARNLPGWADLDGFITHMHIVRAHREQIERVAVATDSRISGVAESLADHFRAAEVRQFAYDDESSALRWLETASTEGGGQWHRDPVRHAGSANAND